MLLYMSYMSLLSIYNSLHLYTYTHCHVNVTYNNITSIVIELNTINKFKEIKQRRCYYYYKATIFLNDLFVGAR